MSAPTVTIHTLRQSDLHGFHKDWQRIILTAVDLGWEPKRLSGGGLVLRSKVPGIRDIRVPNSTKNPPNRDRIERMVMKGADPMRKAAIIAGVEALDSPTTEIAVDVVVPERDTSRDKPPRVRHEKEESMAIVVSTKPYLAAKYARQTGGVRYESKAVLERKWSDGTTDYLCSAGCGFQSPNHMSVARHYGAAHRDAPAIPEKGHEVVDPSYTESMSTRAYSPSDRLVNALEEYLASLPPDAWENPRLLAVGALTWMHERPDLPEPEHAERRELTAEEIIDRVRRLVDGGATVQMRAEINALQERVIQAEERAARAEGDLDALEEMLSSRKAVSG